MGLFRGKIASLVAVAGFASGCSILYNPSNIPPEGKQDAGVDGTQIDAMRDAMPDATPDAPPDAPPGAFALGDLYPTVLVEGQGVGGSRRATLLIRGQNIEPDATVTLTERSGGTIDVTVHDADKVVSADGTMLVVPISVAIDTTRGTNTFADVDVTVSQMRTTAESQTLQALTIQYLPELNATTNPTGMLAPGAYRYSVVDIPTIIPSATTGPIQIRSTSSIRVTQLLDFDAGTPTPGPGGGAGGAGGAALGGTGGTGSGTGGGKPSGGGGGFATKGTDGATAMSGGAIAGDIGISSFDTNRGSGGAGGNGGLGAGGAGGGGGGAIELSADGDLTIAAIDARGGNGASNGGGGSGGTILLRTGGTLSAPAALTATGGTGDGDGSVGRIRVDSPAAAITVNANPPAYRGPRLSDTTPFATTMARPTLTVVGEKLRSFKYYFKNEADDQLRGPFQLAISNAGSNMFAPAEDLFVGGNVFCVEVEGADFAMQKPEARSCVTIVRLP